LTINHPSDEEEEEGGGGGGRGGETLSKRPKN